MVKKGTRMKTFLSKVMSIQWHQFLPLLCKMIEMLEKKGPDSYLVRAVFFIKTSNLSIFSEKCITVKVLQIS